MLHITYPSTVRQCIVSGHISDGLCNFDSTVGIDMCAILGRMVHQACLGTLDGRHNRCRFNRHLSASHDVCNYIILDDSILWLT